MSPAAAVPTVLRVPLAEVLEEGDDGAAVRQRLRHLLAAGGVLAVPTESSYGLAVDPRNRRGVEAVYAVKERDAGKPLPVVVAGGEGLATELAGLEIDLEASAGRRALEALERLGPAPVTVVLPLVGPLAAQGASRPASSRVPAAAGGASLALRVPAHDGLRRLLAHLGPLTATSANPSGAAPILDPAAAAALLADAPAGGAVVEDGILGGGPPSTILRPEPDGGWTLLRPGAVSAERLAAALGVRIAGVADPPSDVDADSDPSPHPDEPPSHSAEVP